MCSYVARWRLRVAVWALSAASFGGCADYASEAELGRVEARVREVATAQTIATARIEERIAAGFQRMDRLEQDQAESRLVLQQMGEGFNVLSEAAQEAYEAAEAVDRRQRRLEADLNRRLDALEPPRLAAAPEAPVLLVGRGRDLRSGLALDALVLELNSDGMSLQPPPPPSAASERLPVREFGDRLYAVGTESETAWCLDIVARQSPYEFTAARCEEPFHVYAFAAT